MNAVSSLTSHSANERQKIETNTSRIDKIKNNILSTARAIDHGLTKMIINGHECDMDNPKFTNLDRANLEIEIRRRENEKRKFLSDMGKSAEKISKEWKNFLH